MSDPFGTFGFFGITETAGGGGVEPDDIAGLMVWFKADAGVEEASADPAEDTDTVQFWRDQSGNADDASQPTGGIRPTYRTGILNSLPILRFSDKILEAANAGTTIGTIFLVVGNVTAGTAPAVCGVTQSGGATALRICTFFPNATTIYSGDASELFGTDFSVRVNGSLTNTFPGSGAYAVVTIRGNSTATIDATSFHIGRSHVNDGYVGDVAEVVVYDSSLGSTDRSNIESYLMTKYGL